MMKSYYQLLNVSQDSPPKEIKAAFSKKFDKLTKKSLTKKRVKQIEELHDACTKLINPVERHQYDVEIGLASSTRDEASWRVHYLNYSKEELERDLDHANDKLARALEEYTEGPALRAIWVMIIVLAFVAVGLFVYGQSQLQEKRGAKLLIGQSAQKSMVAKSVVEEEPENEFQVPADELILVKELPEENQDRINQLFRKLYQISIQTNYPQLKYSCSLFFEDVHLASELETKYTTIHNCFESKINQ